MARLLALAVIRLRQSIDRDGWLKPPYNPDIQRFLDLSAGRNARERGGAWPSSIGLLVRRASLPLSAWMRDTAAWDQNAAYTEEPLLERVMD